MQKKGIGLTDVWLLVGVFCVVCVVVPTSYTTPVVIGFVADEVRPQPNTKRL